jgi:Peptidase propeptide and YPEB domain
MGVPLMRIIRKFVIASVIMAFAFTARAAHADWFSDELPPANAKPLSQIIKAIEDKGFKTITEVDFDDGVWKIEAHQVDGKEITLKVDPMTGEVRQ